MFKSMRAIPLAFLLLVVLFSGIGTAGAGEPANASCLGCHEPSVAVPVFRPVEFVVADVDYSACRSCHWIGMSTLIDGEWSHKHLTNDPQTTCLECHLGQADYPDICDVCVPIYPTAYGFFFSAASLGTSSDDLHAIHANGSWPQLTRFRPNYCASCHAPAACSACHTGAASHGAHTAGSAEYPPETYLQAAGTPVGNPNVLATFTKAVTCTTATCHSRTSATGPGFLPLCTTCHAEDSARHTSVHDVSSALTTGCKRCHGVSLDSIHAKSGLGCEVCHASSDTLVSSAVLASSTACSSCHGSVRHFGRR